MKYPTIIVSGTNDQYYKFPEVIDFMKNDQKTVYESIESFESTFLRKLNKIHG